MPEEVVIGPGTTLRVLTHSDDLLEFEASYAGGGAAPPAHLHPEQDERFEVRAGALQVRLAGRERVIVAGDVLEVSRGTAHQMWNASADPAVVNWRTMPAGRTLDWFREIAALQRGQGRSDPASLLSDYSDVFRLADG
jgi:mannose-6-phosphate isomerase-like protein (cupin superfamily)